MTTLTYAGLEAATAVGLLEPARDLDGAFRFPHGLARQAVLDLLTEFQPASDNGCVATVLDTSALDGVTIDDQNPTHIRGIAALGRAQTFTGDHERSRINCMRAIALARATGDVGLVATALQISLQTANSPDQLHEKLCTAMELTALAGQIHDIRHLGPAAYHRAAICYIQGDPVGLATAHTDLARAARATGQPFWEWVESCLVFGRMFLRCDFSAAMQTIAAARELGRTFEPNSETEGPFGLQTFMVRRETGGLEQVRALVSGQEDPPTHWAPGLLALYCELGMVEPARRATDFLLESEMPRHHGSATWPVVLSFLCDAVVWLDDPVGAARLYPLAKEYAGLNLLGAEFLALVGSGDRQLGSLESVLHLPTAADRFRSALEMDTRMGSPLHVATTLAADAAHLRKVGQEPGRRDELTRRALGLCDQYGLARVRRLLTESPTARRARTAPGGQNVSSGRVRKLPAGLTAREAEVLSLLGIGCSNRGIADRLFISENTAAHHVRSILMKTGAANRTQAAMYASSTGCSVPPSFVRNERIG